MHTCHTHYVTDVDCLTQHVNDHIAMWLHELLTKPVTTRNVTESAKICMRQMRISYEKSVGRGFVARSKFLSTTYYSYCDLT